METKKIYLSKIGQCFVVFWALGFFFSNPVQAYYSYVRNGQRTLWPAGTFTANHTGDTTTIPGVDLSGLNVGAPPNDDTLGLLFATDAQVLRDQGGSGSADCTTTSSGTSDFGPPSEAEYSAVYSALAAWDILATSTVNLAFVCNPVNIVIANFRTDIYNSGVHIINGINEIVFDDTVGGLMIAELMLGLDPSTLLGVALPFDENNNLIIETGATGNMVEGVILINKSDQLSPAAAAIDLQAVLTHEVGHFLGLAHVPSLNIDLNDDTQVPTMYPFALGDSAQARSLEFDDVAGITVSYPISGHPIAGFGSISGDAVSTAGGSLVGAAVLAIDAAGNEISVLLGGNPDISDTRYVIDAIPPGSYTVRMAALDGGVEVSVDSGGSIDPILPFPSASFPTVYFDNVSDISLTTPVEVTSGADTPNINFGTSSNGGNGGNNLGGNGEGLFGQVLSSNSNCQAFFVDGPLGLYSAIPLFLPFFFIGLYRRKLRQK
jgi:hypothetical protein